jgi:hypothetical protein
MTLLTYAVEPLLPTVFTHTSSPSAYPYTRQRYLSPFQPYLSWNDSSDDALMIGAVQKSTTYLREIVAREGQRIAGAPLYPNYAAATTTAEEIYGDALPRLKSIKKRVDPMNVMDLAGGFKI